MLDFQVSSRPESQPTRQPGQPGSQAHQVPRLSKYLEDQMPGNKGAGRRGDGFLGGD